MPCFVLRVSCCSGYFAEVRECVHKATNQKYAVKIIEKSTLGCSNMEDIRTEIAVLRRAGHHPNVVALIDMFEDDIEVYIVMEL